MRTNYVNFFLFIVHVLLVATFCRYELPICHACRKAEKLWKSLGHLAIPYRGKVWWAECLANLLFSSVWQKKVWRMNRSAKGLSMVTTNLDGFSLANRRRFAKFAKLSPRQTFPLYGS